MPLHTRSHSAFLFDDLLTSKMCLFQTYDSSSKSSISSCSRGSKSSDETVGGYAKSALNRRTTLLNLDSDQESPKTDLRHRPSTSLQRRTSSSVPSSPFSVSSLESSNENSCELCNSFTHERQYHLWKSRYTKSSFCTHCAEDTLGKSYVSYWGSPTYQRGSWKRRFRAERSTDIDLTPLFDVLKRIDQMDTSMGIPLEAYTKHLPKHTEENGVVSSCHKNEENMWVNDPIQNNRTSGSTEVKSRPEIGTENSSNCQTMYREIQRLPSTVFKTNTFCKDINEGNELDKDVKNMDSQKVAGNHFESRDAFVSGDSDSEFENIFKDALQYNKRLKKKNTHNTYINGWLDKNPCENKSECLRNSSTRYLNTHDLKPSREYNLTDKSLQSEKENTTHEQKTTRSFNVDYGRKKSVQSSIEKGKKTKERKSKEFSSDDGDIKSTDGTDKLLISKRKKQPSKLKRSFDTERRQNSQRKFNEQTERKRFIYAGNSPENVGKKTYGNETIDIQDDQIITLEYTQRVDKVPDSYEAFNNSLERGTFDGRIKRSSTVSMPRAAVVKPSQDSNEQLTTNQPVGLRRNSVSQLTAFWEQKLISGSGNVSECSDQESENNQNQLVGTCPDTLKSHLVTNIQENAANSETGTDEDENFRKIQNKLENLTKHSMRYNMRRKSILKNKNITSSFLNEFLTVPAARTRNSDSDSGGSVCSGMKPEQLAKRRVSFQSNAVPSSSSSSSSDEYIHTDEESDLCNVQGSGCATKHTVNLNADKSEPTGEVFPSRPSIHITEIHSGKTEVVDLDNNSAEENAENEHIVWRKEHGLPGKSSAKVLNMFYSTGEEQSFRRRLFEPETVSGKSTTAASEKVTHEYRYKTTEIRDKNIVLTGTDDTSNKSNETSKIGDTDFPNGANDRDVACRSVEKPEESQKFVTGALKQVSSNIFDKTPPMMLESSKGTVKTNGFSIRTNTVDDTIEKSTIKHVYDGKNKESVREASDDKDTGMTPRKRRPRAKLLSIAGEESPDEYSKLLDNPVELDSDDSSDVELSWRTRGYSGDFYVSRKSTTGSEIINKFRQVVMRKKSKERNITERRKPFNSQTKVKIQRAMGTCV